MNENYMPKIGETFYSIFCGWPIEFIITGEKFHNFCINIGSSPQLAILSYIKSNSLEQFIAFDAINLVECVAIGEYSFEVVRSIKKI